MNRKPVYGHWSKLSISEDEISVFVEGGTFRYGFDKKSGLISRIEVLGDDFLRGTDSHVPDIYVSNARDPRESFYAAKYEDEAECDVISANPYEVHIRTHGIYHNPSGETFPVRYRITYEIQSDGTMFVIVHNKVYEPCIMRWLCISRGLLNPSLCEYFSHLADQSEIDTTENYTFKNLQIPPSPPLRKGGTIAGGKAQDQRCGHDTGASTLFSGRFIPWFWLGNDRTGIEICVWDVTHHRYGSTQIGGKTVDPLGEVGANISVSASPGGVLWEIFSLRNLRTPVEEGLEQVNYFALSVTPPKNYNPGFADLRVHWEGPRWYNESYKYLSDDEIRDLSRMGYNLIIGGVNWRSGEYIPDNEDEVKGVISICHKHGMKIIPCVPLMDLNEDTAVFGEHGPEWRIEPAVEYEYETSLMCPGAEGWREHWIQQMDRIAEDYDFDGVFLDLWYDRLACRNPRHGCQRRYMRPTFPWVRDMLRHAGAKFKAKDHGSTIVANTDLLPISMICSWLDVRSVGASQDVRHIDQLTGKAFYSSYRLGCNSLMWLDRGQKIDHHAISLSLLYMAPIILSRERSREEIELTRLYWNILRFFGISEARWYPGFVDDPKIKVAEAKAQAGAGEDRPRPYGTADVYVNVHRRDATQIPPNPPLIKGGTVLPLSKEGTLLLTLVNLSPNEVRASISLMDFAELGLQDDKEYLVYEPVSRRFLEGRECWSCDDLRRHLTVTLPGHSPRLLYIREWADKPILLFALGSDRVLEEQWDENTRTLQFQLAAPAGADISLAVHSPVGKPTRIASAGEEIQFTWDSQGQKLALFDIQTSDITTTISVNL